MINVLLPSMGNGTFFKDSFFPKPLIEISGKTMLELVLEDFKSIQNSQMIYAFSKDDCNQFHLDASVKLLDSKAKVLALKNQTAGALCTSLIAIDMIDNEDPLVIANCDQILDVDYQTVIAHFEMKEADAGVIAFPSIHPRWSYISVVAGNVVEVAEKRPLSRKAIAGFYYFKKGCNFVEAAKKAILKKNCVDGKYYISSSLNELILMGCKVSFYDISKEQYHSFYSPEKILEYEKGISSPAEADRRMSI